MKTFISFFALLFLSIQTIAQPFAPKIDPPKNPNDDPEIAFAIQILQGVSVPDRNEVGISPYPGAKIFQTTIAQSGFLATVRLFSMDDVSTVTQYYKKELSDWKFKDLYGTNTFFKGDEMKAMMLQEPVIQIVSAELFSKTMPSAKTAITIGYNQ
jgi:hypothetical protein